MNTTPRTWLMISAAIAVTVIVGFIVYLAKSTPRSEALEVALSGLRNSSDENTARTANAIWSNFLETRLNAMRWSGIFWGCTFTAAAFSALAALVLKLDFILSDEGAKKDIAAILSVSAALLVTISSSGDFQRKWNANRIASAELEEVGYEMLGTPTADPTRLFMRIGTILRQRNLLIVGNSSSNKPQPITRDNSTKTE